MFSSKGNAPAQQAPGWKKSGLKHQQSAAASSPTVGHPSTTHEGTPSKRKLDAHAPPPSNSSHVAKRPRKDETTGDRNGQLKKRKFVTFADAAPKDDKNNSKNNKSTASNTKSSDTTTPQRKSKGPAKKVRTTAPADLKPALEYLRLWQTARASWKFNKNHQSVLIKHVFDADRIPAADIDAFYDYISDLKGLVRMRLREAALEIRTKDRSQGGAAFPEGTADIDAAQERYETILAKFLQSQQVGAKRKAFAEAEYLSDSDDEDDIIIQRLVKRMRAELVLDELSDGTDTDMSTTSSSSSRTIAASDTNTTTGTNIDKRMKLNDGTGKRRRKLRVNMDDSDSTSSSESESEADSDSDTSSSGSSSSSSGDSSSDDDDDAQNQRDNDETSSSSSSSSSEADSDDSSDEDSD